MSAAPDAEITMPDESDLPGYVAGTWQIDPVHSEVGFAVRHLMVSKVRGRFRQFEGRFVTAPRPRESTVSATIEMASVDTGNDQRDGHLRSADFFDVDRFPTMTYRGEGLRVHDGQLVLDGDLTLKGITTNVPLAIELNGFAEGPDGQPISGFSATGQLDRRDFGVTFDARLPGGAIVAADRIDIHLEAEATLVP